MATWTDVKNYLDSKYSIEIETIKWITVNHPLANGRSQSLVFLDHGETAGESWVGIGTVIGDEQGVNHLDLLKMNAEFDCGGIALLEDGTLMFQYAIRLDNLDEGELEDPIQIVAGVGDELSQRFVS